MENTLFAEGEEIMNNEKLEYRQKKVRFKEYTVEKTFLLPLTSDDFIPENHIARLIHQIVERMDLSDLIKKYKGGGASSYNPKMMLKAWLLGFVYKIHSSRGIEQALKENLAFIWISGQNKPDFRTLNDFRLKLKEDIKKIFKQIILLGMELGIIDGKDIFIDHTKVEANANPHKIVWKKSINNQLERINKELDILFDYIDKLNIEEDEKYYDKGIEVKAKIDIEKIEEMVKIIDNKVKNKEMDKAEGKESKNNLKRAKELMERKESYEEKKAILGKRNSYSRTDKDATAMRQKDGVSTKASYNEGIAVENGFVVNYEISQSPADNVNFKEVVDGVIDNLDRVPENVHTDGAYGNEENMAYLEEKNIGNYLKYKTYRKEKSKKWHREKVRREDFYYDHQRDCYICLNGKELRFKCEYEEILPSGYKQNVREYKADEKDCGQCVFKEYCTSVKSRGISVSMNYERLKSEARKNLDSEKGEELRKQRGYQVESHFGARKLNDHYRRYVLRGLEKVKIESGLYYMSVNIKKIYNYLMRLILISGVKKVENSPLLLGI